MIDNLSTKEKEKISRLIAEMIQLILNVNIDCHGEELVNLYLKYVSRIDDGNPIKDLPLLKESFAISFLRLLPRPSNFLLIYDMNKYHEKPGDEGMEDDDII